jgi:putative ATP-dependent endonuclease of the OLD family
MKLDSMTLSGYRCFDETGQTITLDDLTCFVGPNASGKTAAMLALARMFGETRAQRQVVPSDFHLALGENLNDQSPRVLTIDCYLRFPEVDLEGGDATAAGVPETFNQMIVNEPGGTPYCRIRLEATWTDDGTISGDIEQRLWWITTSSNDSSIIEQNRIGVKPADRSKIRVVYLGAVRNPSEQIQATGSSFGRILEAVEWNGADVAVRENLTQLQGLIEGIVGVGKLNSELQTAWNGFYDGEVAKAVSFKSGDEDPASLIKRLAAAFSPGEAQPTMEVSQLSDGLRSLFSVALSLGLFRVEELVRSTPVSGFKSELNEKAPIVTVFAIEEPENHLSPQYLGRILNQLIDLSTNARAQIVLSSHSPSIMRRVEPDSVRYFLGHELRRVTEVKNIPLPDDPADEAFKYVREAVRGFPELYFARLVILGEGPSEEIVFRRIFEASGTPLDQHFISVAPLGGRHVNHFWRLLHGLNIPYLTVLDLDREKEGAGWGRVQYVRDQLVKRFGPGHPKLKFEDETGVARSLNDASFDTLRDNSDVDTGTMGVWLTRFREQFDTYFMTPLDLDFAMLEQFPDSYKGVVEPGRGPRLPEAGSTEYATTILQRMRQVLAADPTKAPATLGSSYEPKQQELFAWYKYLFIDGSKPVTHMLALSKIADDILATDAPECLRQLIARAGWLVKHVQMCDDSC